MSIKRDEIIATTCELLELQGYHATGLNRILQESGAPKGSLYHYFPAGKEELAAAAMARSGASISANIEGALAAYDDPTVAVTGFIRELAGYVAASGYRQGGPITAVALEAASTSERLRLACRDEYRGWQALFAAKLGPAHGAARAGRLAALIIAAIEGGIILARSEQSEQPLHDVADEIEALLAAAGERPAALA
jgi:TetR/AcrR family transcriptional repressor of lmrAB and yxaGH operons